MSNTLEAIHLLQEKIKKLLANYEFLQQENNALLQNNTELQFLLKKKEQQILENQEQYNLLKVAKTIEGSKENTRETKLKINALIREIDKCIIQLNT